jgi:hypothetical protein
MPIAGVISGGGAALLVPDNCTDGLVPNKDSPVELKRTDQIRDIERFAFSATNERSVNKI